MDNGGLCCRCGNHAHSVSQAILRRSLAEILDGLGAVLPLMLSRRLPEFDVVHDMPHLVSGRSAVGGTDSWLSGTRRPLRHVGDT